MAARNVVRKVVEAESSPPLMISLPDVLARMGAITSKGEAALSSDDLDFLGSVFEYFLEHAQADFGEVDLSKPILLKKGNTVEFSFHAGENKVTLFPTKLDIFIRNRTDARKYVRFFGRQFIISVRKGVVSATEIYALSDYLSKDKSNDTKARNRLRPRWAEENRPKKMINLRLWPDILEAVDEQCHKERINRTDWITRAIQRALEP